MQPKLPHWRSLANLETCTTEMLISRAAMVDSPRDQMEKLTAIKLAASIAFLFTDSTILSAASRTACDLLDAQMATSLAGAKVDAPMDGGFLCVYAAKNRKASVEFSVSDASTRDANRFLRSHGGAKQGDTYESIPSLPTKNLLVVASYQKHSLTVFVKEKEINLIVGRPMTPELKAAMVEVMKRVLARL